VLQKNNETAILCDVNRFTTLSQKLLHIKMKIQKLYRNHIHKRENSYTHILNPSHSEKQKKKVLLYLDHPG